VSNGLIAFCIIVAAMLVEGLVIWFAAITHERNAVEAQARADEAKADTIEAKTKARIIAMTDEQIAKIPTESGADIANGLLK
jgi:hypothetical protein